MFEVGTLAGGFADRVAKDGVVIFPALGRFVRRTTWVAANGAMVPCDCFKAGVFLELPVLEATTHQLEWLIVVVDLTLETWVT